MGSEQLDAAAGAAPERQPFAKNRRGVQASTREFILALLLSRIGITCKYVA
jgi:hypothetical protein